MRLRDKVVVITGAASGMGRSMARGPGVRPEPPPSVGSMGMRAVNFRLYWTRKS